MRSGRAPDGEILGEAVGRVILPPDIGHSARLAERDLQTLRFGPLWILSGLAGTSNRFHGYELAAFWDTIVAVALRAARPTRDLLTSMAADRSGLLAAFASDDRPVVSGLRHVVAVLERLDDDQAAAYRLALLRIGGAVARGRGPYGRAILPEHEQTLLLMAELLEMESSELELNGPALV